MTEQLTTPNLDPATAEVLPEEYIYEELLLESTVESWRDAQGVEDAS